MKRISKEVKVGSIVMGGANPVTVQSMTNADPYDFEAVLNQTRQLQEAGCDIVRMTVPDESAAGVFSVLKRSGITVPLVADVHFDHRAAIAAAMSGADKIRINPGNIGDSTKVKEVANTCATLGIPIRIGVNSGSLDRRILEKYGAPTAEALAESAFEEADRLESFGFSDIVISVKSSSITTMVDAMKIVASKTDYPLHIGVTEAGGEYSGIIKSAAGIGALLLDGIGDTVRVSLTADPVREVTAGREILKALGMTDGGIDVVSCPTCGRTKIDIISISDEFSKAVRDIDCKGKKLKVAIMGCAVNGPGEAKDADFGIAGGDGFAVLFEKGNTVGRIEEADIMGVLLEKTKEYIGADKAQEK